MPIHQTDTHAISYLRFFTNVCQHVPVLIQTELICHITWPIYVHL